MNHVKNLDIFLIDISASMQDYITKVNEYILFRKTKKPNSYCTIITFGNKASIKYSLTMFRNISSNFKAIDSRQSLTEGLNEVNDYLKSLEMKLENISLIIITDGELLDNDIESSPQRLESLCNSYRLTPFLLKLGETQIEQVKKTLPSANILDNNTKNHYPIISTIMVCGILLLLILYNSNKKTEYSTLEKNLLKKISMVKDTMIHSKKPKNYLVHAKGHTYTDLINLYGMKDEYDNKVIFNLLREYNRQFISGDIRKIQLKDTITELYLKVPNLSSMLLDTIDEGDVYSTLHSKQMNNELKFIKITRIKK